MRTHYGKWLIFGGFVLAVALVSALFVAFTPNEPTYAGKKLSRWLDELAALDHSKRWEPQTKEVQALRAIGTNALPWLLSELQSNGGLPARLNPLLAKQSVIKHRFRDINTRMSRATLGFEALGELAKPAIPSLLSLVESKPGFVPAALAAIGPAAIPALQQCLTNTRSYATSVGQIIPIPGNTIGAIHNAMTAGRISREEIASLMPAIRSSAQSTNRNTYQYNYAVPFLKDFDH